jgi:plastocyanin
MAVKRLYRLVLAAAMASELSACAEDIRNADSGTDAGIEPDSGTDAGDDGGIDTDTDTGPGDTVAWVTAGYVHSCAVIEGGYVKCWGDPDASPQRTA